MVIQQVFDSTSLQKRTSYDFPVRPQDVGWHAQPQHWGQDVDL